MKILISLSAVAASKFTKGLRVIVRLSKDEWHVGSISRAGASSVSVLFDDESKATVSGADLKWVRAVEVNAARVRKRPITDAGAKLLYTPTVTGTKPARLKPVEPKLKPVEPEPKPKFKPVEPKSKQKPASSLEEEEALMLRRAGSPSEFARIGSNRTAMHAYITSAWKRANTSFFDNRLAPIIVRLSKDTGTGFRRRGAWHPSQRTISISPRLFLAGEAQVLTTVVHEMCHQWVSEVDGSRDRTEGGHGHEWQTRMRRCGLLPSRYSKYDNMTFMTDEERSAAERVKARRLEVAKEAVDKKLKPVYPYELKNFFPAKYHDPKADTWVSGLIVGRNDLAGKRWNFISTPSSSSWKIIPSTWFYHLESEAEGRKFLSPEFRRAGESINGYKESKRQASSDKRSMRKGAFALWNM